MCEAHLLTRTLRPVLVVAFLIGSTQPASAAGDPSVTCRLIRAAQGTPQERVEPTSGSPARDHGHARPVCVSLDEPLPSYTVSVAVSFQAGDGEAFTDIEGYEPQVCEFESTSGQVLAEGCTVTQSYPIGSAPVGPLHRARFDFTTPNGTETFVSSPWASDLLCQIAPAVGGSAQGQDIGVASASCGTADLSRSYPAKLTITPQYRDAGSGEWVSVATSVCEEPSVVGQASIEGCHYVDEAGPDGVERRVRFVLEADKTRLVQHFPPSA